jgi:phosphatidylserine/phosphatidylglycerophosphate/cardiolipin synthase-like enzyme
MSIDVKVYNNGDHITLIWLPSDRRPIAECRGFAIKRVVQGGDETFLHGFVGFSDNDKPDPNAPWKFPVQRFMWWDYGVSPGQTVQYSIVPVTGDQHNLKLATAMASALTPPLLVTGQMSPHVAAYFNKGIVSAQWVSRALDAIGPNPRIADIIGTPGNKLRDALSGLLRPQILAMLDDVKKNRGKVFAALYELNDPELLAALKTLGKQCHLILANGAFSKKNDNDENKAVRAQLRNVVDLHDRLVPSGHFAHNKFLVCCDSAGKPQRVLTGSTNWTMTGLCTQANNGIIVNDPNVAQDFLDEWNLLLKAKNAYPASLAHANSKSRTFNVDGGTVTQWFAPTDGGVDLDYARNLINAAKQGILFLFFNPGVFVPEGKPASKWTLLQNILFRHHEGTPFFDGELYIRGVVNQEIEGLTTEAKAAKPSTNAALDPSSGTPVSLFNGGKQPPQRLGYESMVPKNIKDTFHNWATEILGQGVHIHSKVIVLDPFGDKPVVMTGSHNLGFKASSKNDDNLMIVEGNPRLAAAYAANIIAIYQSYRWNAYVEQHRQDPRAFHVLVDNDSWQQGHLTGDELAELTFWMGMHNAAIASNTVAAQPARHVPELAPVAGKKRAPSPLKHAAARKKAAAIKTKKPVGKAARRKRAPKA